MNIQEENIQKVNLAFEPGNARSFEGTPATGPARRMRIANPATQI